MICNPCKERNHTAENCVAFNRNETWCDCQHRVTEEALAAA